MTQSAHSPIPNLPGGHRIWLGDGSGRLTAQECRLLRQSLRLQPRDVSDAMAVVGRDCPPKVVAGWEGRQSKGPPDDVCAFLWACDVAVHRLMGRVLQAWDQAEGQASGTLPPRHGDQATAEVNAPELRGYALLPETLRALHAAAWDRAALKIRFTTTARIAIP
jgi:hypothetical protein